MDHTEARLDGALVYRLKQGRKHEAAVMVQCTSMGLASTARRGRKQGPTPAASAKLGEHESASSPTRR